MALYMLVERYAHGPGSVYERAARHGRMLPDGLRDVDSWVVADEALDRCFQLMDTDDPSLLDVWRARSADLGDFDVHPVISSAEAAARVAVTWGGGTDPEPAADPPGGAADHGGAAG